MDHLMKNMYSLFNPSSVAVIGASDNMSKLGFHVMKSLINGKFPGKIIPINPGSNKVMGIDAYPSIKDYKGEIDLAIVVLPARLVPDIFNEFVDKGVKGSVLITAGFKEIDDPSGAHLQIETANIVNSAGIPVIGPNTFGMINLNGNLNASFTPEFSNLKKGNICLVSQSGGISHLLGFMAMGLNIGFSKIIGLGNRLNIDFDHMIDYLMSDPDTKVITLYIEGIDNIRGLIDSARKNRGQKPIIAYKTGKGKIGNQASMSHTGSMAGRHELYRSAFDQAGILSIDNTETLLDTAKALSVCPLPEGPCIAVLSGQAGPSMAACDLLESEGLKIDSFTGKTQEKINELLPPLALRTNPVDMGPAWYDSVAIQGIIKAVMNDENIHGIIFLMMFASANVDALKGIKETLIQWQQKKPVISCILSPPTIWDEEINELEAKRGIVNYPTPERAAKAMANLWKYAIIK